MRTETRVALLVVVLVASSAMGQPGRRGRGAAPVGGAPPPLAARAPVAAEKDDYFAVVGGTVHTGTGLTIPGATVLCNRGKIVEVGSSVRVPEGARVLDATGHQVFPGFVAMRSAGILSGAQPENASDVFALNLTLALAAGITTAETSNTAAKLTLGSVEDMVVKRDLFQSVSYHSSNPDGKRRLREQLDRLVQYRRDVAAFEEAKRRGDENAKEPDRQWIRGEYERLQRLLDGEAVALVDANSAWDLLQLCELAERYGIRIVARGAREAWTVADRISRAGIACILTPRDADEPDDRLNRPTGSHIENAARLHAAGVRVAFIPAGGYFGPGYQISLGGLAGRDLLHYSLEAAFAVRGGLSEDAAIRALTIDAARILGIEERVGSIEAGKDADFAITDGNPLSYMTMTRWTVVNGRVVYDKAKETLFDHIRPAGDRNAPPPEDYWPRRLGDEPR